MDLLQIRDLQVEIAGKQVLRGVDLTITSREVHAIMGANGSGKSSLAMTLMGNTNYAVLKNPKVTDSRILFSGKDLLSMSVDERARAGLYLAWQNPMAIPGVSVFSLCKASYEAKGETIASLTGFKRQLEELALRVGLTKEHVSRGVNEGFSGGEKKRLELLQLLLLSPKLAILDEIDSGLDVDALKLVGEIVVEMKKKGTSFILITHYKRLLEYVQPDYIHVMTAGKIVQSGGM